MTLTLPRLIDGMIASLRDSVLLAVSDNYARGQLEGVINLLATMGLRAEWSPALFRRQIAIQREALQKLTDLGHRLGETAFVALLDDEEQADTETLENQIGKGDQMFERLLGIADAEIDTNSALSASIYSILDDAMKRISAEEWRSTAENALARMSGA